MTLNELKEQIILTIRDLKEHGVFPKENHLYDYKKELNFFGINDALEIFMRNLAKDILSFSNGNGGIIILGIEENTATGKLNDTGLDSKNLDLLTKIDLNLITQKFEKITKTGVNIDLQSFQLGTRQFYYLLIEKQNQVLIPINDFNDYKIKKGEILYRASSKNEIANHSTQDFNRFLQIKSNEKNKTEVNTSSKTIKNGSMFSDGELDMMQYMDSQNEMINQNQIFEIKTIVEKNPKLLHQFKKTNLNDLTRSEAFTIEKQIRIARKKKEKKMEEVC